MVKNHSLFEAIPNEFSLYELRINECSSDITLLNDTTSVLLYHVPYLDILFSILIILVRVRYIYTKSMA